VLKESLKYFFLTLIGAASILLGMICFRRYFVEKTKEPEPLFDMISAAAINATPDISASDVSSSGAGTEPAAWTATPAPFITPSPTHTPESFESRLERYIADLPIQEKIGQLMMFRFSGPLEPDAPYQRLIQEYQIGNFLLLGPNIDRKDATGGFETCRILTGNLQDGAKIPALIAIDIEGGKVIRFRWEEWPKSAAALGNNGDPDAAEKQFLKIAIQLRDCGINVDLAPVLDVSTDPDQTVLKTRIISSDPNTVASIGTAAIRGLQEGACLSAAKHFPGHGGTDSDSHDTLPVIGKTLNELAEYDLVPFKAAIDAGVDFILMAHILYPEIDSEFPASLSEKIMTSMLRGAMGFEGIIISDDFRMKALTKGRTIGEAAVQFFLAGGDMILCGPNTEYQNEILTAVSDAVERGLLPLERIDESLFRVLLKKHIAMNWELSN
jgi:beta-N-acetylhexosaminidase